jgi:hypothetical protein
MNTKSIIDSLLSGVVTLVILSKGFMSPVPESLAYFAFLMPNAQQIGNTMSRKPGEK